MSRRSGAMTSRPPSLYPALNNNAEAGIASTIYVAIAITMAVMPGSMLGAAVTFLMWRATRPSILISWLLGALGALTAATVSRSLALAWPWHWLLHDLAPRAPAVPPDIILHSVQVEALLGPLLVAAFQFATVHWGRTIQG
jgi:hypothetical protein